VPRLALLLLTPPLVPPLRCSSRNKGLRWRERAQASPAPSPLLFLRDHARSTPTLLA